MWLIWLIENKVLQAMDQGRLTSTISAEDRQKIEARHTSNGSHIMQVTGDTASIAIQGVLTPTPDFFAMFFGGGNTTYPDIISAVAEAEADPKVTNIEFEIDSPGGTTAGMFETAAVISAAKKPTKAIGTNVVASAALGLAAAADEIVASNRSTEFGSVGVAVSVFVDDDVVDVTSTEAPEKRPDMKTEEGQAVVRKRLDAIHQLFAEQLAEGRDTTVAKVNKDFGRGNMLVASKALERGMIDSIEEPKLSVVSPASKPTALAGQQMEARSMDRATLIAQEPKLYAELVAEGVIKERDRVEEHLVLGKESGDMKTALEAVSSGTEMTGKLRSTYLVASMNRQTLELRVGDEDGLEAADKVDPKKLDGKDQGDAVCSALFDRLGLKMGDVA